MTDAERKELEKERLYQHMLAIEKVRTAKERYSVKEISLWMLWGPFAGILIACFAGFDMWQSKGADALSDWWVIALSLTPVILFGIASNVDNVWQASVKAKCELDVDRQLDSGLSDWDLENTNHRTLNGHVYIDHYIYTDDAVGYWVYRVAKFAFILSTLVLAAGIAILLFSWLGAISIAPTTIIIILLVLILVKK